jgi:rhodanese-related sulfurtransferase
MTFLSNLFGFKSVDYKFLIQNGAVIIDVRSPQEFNGGHIKGSQNVPLQQLQQSMSKIPKDKVVITCCASGIRSASAKSILKSAGYPEVHNGGGWMSLNSKL